MTITTIVAKALVLSVFIGLSYALFIVGTFFLVAPKSWYNKKVF
jgi:hypothetical protein